MNISLKKIDQQVIVITGASSGIGLATARMAAERGAQVVMVARDSDDLTRHAEAIQRTGGKAAALVADVADGDALRAVAETVVSDFGRIDTWVNNAGSSIYGVIEQVPVEDARRLFDTNYWGMVNGSLAALPHLKRHGGALINVGSVVGDTAIPLQGHYSASKHAVRGFTDALRLELMDEGAPVSVTLIKPASIDTPYPLHARNYMEVEPALPAPVYAPEVVAEAILACAQHPQRDIYVGGGGALLGGMEKVAPALADRYKVRTMVDGQRSERPARGRGDTLYASEPHDATVRGQHDGRVMKSSAYTTAMLHRGTVVISALVLGAVVGLARKAVAKKPRKRLLPF